MSEDKKQELNEPQIPLEELFDKLEQAVRNLESPDVTLEESFGYYNTGMNLLKQCNEAIDAVEKKVLVLDEEGKTHEF